MGVLRFIHFGICVCATVTFHCFTSLPSVLLHICAGCAVHGAANFVLLVSLQLNAPHHEQGSSKNYGKICLANFISSPFRAAAGSRFFYDANFLSERIFHEAYRMCEMEITSFQHKRFLLTFSNSVTHDYILIH